MFLRGFPLRGRQLLSSVLLYGIIAIGMVVFLNPRVEAAQTIPYKINFQGRLTNSAGNLMPDGLYNMKFRIFDASTAGTQLWTETRDTTNRVQITNGLFSVQLGDVTALSPSLFTSASPIFFEIELPTPATATCTTSACGVFTEGAMAPRNPLGATAYAFNADTIDGIDGASLAQLTAANTFTGVNIFSNAANSFSGSTLQAASSVQTALLDSVSGALNVGTTNATAINLGKTGSNITTTINGLFVAKPTTGNDSTAAFQVQNAASASVLTVDTVNSQLIVKGNAAANVAVLGIESFTASYSFPATAGWIAISGTGPSATATHTAGGGTTNLSPTPAMSIVAGNTYQVTFTTSGSPTSTETLTPKIGGASGTVVYGNVTETQVITATTTGNLAFVPTNNWNGTIKTVLVPQL